MNWEDNNGEGQESKGKQMFFESLVGRGGRVWKSMV